VAADKTYEYFTPFLSLPQPNFALTTTQPFSYTTPSVIVLLHCSHPMVARKAETLVSYVFSSRRQNNV
jgi:hypothetical protein